MLVKENLYKNSKNLPLGEWKTNVTQKGNIIEASKIDEYRITTYIQVKLLQNENLIEGESCTCQFDFQRLEGQECRISPLMLRSEFKYITDNDLRKIKLKGKYNYKNIDITSDADNYIKFMIKNFIFSKGEEFPDLWIPSTEDLKDPELYPVKVSGGGTEFTEIKPL